MRLVKLAVAVLALSVTSLAQNYPPSLTRQMPAGGRLILDLEAGAYDVVGTSKPELTVLCDAREPERMRNVHLKVTTVNGADKLSVEDTPNNNFHCRIELPRNTDLKVRLTAGDLQIKHMDGDQDVESRAGNVEIEVADPKLYGPVDASVWSGGLDAAAFGVNKGGLFRSFQLNNGGKLRLHVKLKAGGLTIRKAAGA
jgi:hypothetical protein